MFLLVPGLKLNSQKSLLIGVNVTQAMEEQAAQIMNFNVGELHTLYLGLPLGGNT